MEMEKEADIGRSTDCRRGTRATCYYTKENRTDKAESDSDLYYHRRKWNSTANVA